MPHIILERHQEDIADANLMQRENSDSDMRPEVTVYGALNREHPLILDPAKTYSNLPVVA